MKTTDERNYTDPILTFEECKAILCKDGESYSDEEIESIRQLILRLVQIEYMNFARSNEKSDSKDDQPGTNYKKAS